MIRRFAKAILPASLHARLRPLGRLPEEVRVAARVTRDRLAWRARTRPHGLPGALIVSLTSHPARFPTLHRTLKSLLQQSVEPDRLILWLGEDAVDRLPGKVRRLTREGLEIRTVRHLGSYSKLVHALAAFPDGFICTVDDDVYYEPGWLETLVAPFDPVTPAILCRRAHRLRTGEDGRIVPYVAWEKDVADAAARAPSADLVATGVGGVLYPPGALHPDVTDEALFMRLSPSTDDFWFYWMARRAGSFYRKVGERFDYMDWPGSQTSTLHADNLTGGYDRQIEALSDHLGLPGERGPDIALATSSAG